MWVDFPLITWTLEWSQIRGSQTNYYCCRHSSCSYHMIGVGPVYSDFIAALYLVCVDVFEE